MTIFPPAASKTWAANAARFGAILLLCGCSDGVDYYLGPPPGPAKLEVVGASLDTVESRRRLVYAVRCEIDPGDFGRRRYKILLEPRAGGWTTRAKPVGAPMDTLRDTVWCATPACGWSGGTIDLLAEADARRNLVVASVAIDTAGIEAP